MIRAGATVESPMAPSDADSGAHPAHRIVGALFGRDGLYVVVLAANLLSSVAVTPIVTRLVSPRQFGGIALGIAVSQVIWAVADCGLAVAVQREYATKGLVAARSLLPGCVIVSFAATGGVICTLRLWGSAIGLGRGSVVLEEGLIVGGLMAATGGSFAVMRCRRALKSFALVSCLQVIGGQGLGLAFVLTGKPSASSYLTGLLAGYAIAFLLGIAIARPVIPKRRAVAGVASALAFSLPLVPQQVADFIMNAGDRAVVRMDVGAHGLGRYQVAYNVGSFVMVFLVFVNRSWLPRILEISDRETRWQVLAAARDEMCRLLVPTTVAVALAAPIALDLWAPRSYGRMGLVSVVVVVALASFPFATLLPAQQGLLSLGRSRVLAGTTALSACANIALNVALVPVMGLVGSALATLLSFWLLSASNGYALRKVARLPGMARTVKGIVCCGVALVVLIVLGLPYGGIWTWLRLCLLVTCLGMFGISLRRIVRGPAEQRGGSLDSRTKVGV